jgi:hypothetical protein
VAHDADDSFVSRWSRRKADARAGMVAPAEPAVAEAAERVATPPISAPPALETAARTTPSDSAASAVPAPPTMADVALLTRDADYTRYLGSNVSPDVKNAALKHLFTDPHFNVMDGLDIYTGDYNTPDPLPAGMLRQMVQSQLLGLFDEDVDAKTQAQARAASVALEADAPCPMQTADPTPLATDENPDLQLQPDDGAGRPGAEPRPGAHAGRPD